MRRLAIPLLAGLFVVSSLFALSCGSGTDNETAASPTAKATVAGRTAVASPTAKAAAASRTPAASPATKTAAAGETPTPTRAPVPPPNSTAAPTSDEPTRNFDLLQLCLGVADEGWRQVCAAVASRDISKCGQMPAGGAVDKADMQAICSFFVAAATNDTAICDDIQALVPGFDPASFALGPYGSDCYMYVAVASNDASLCGGTQSQAGCEHNVAIAEGAVPLDQCDDFDCLFDYALRNHSSEACEKLASSGETMRTSCLAMLSGDPGLCDSLKGVGVTEWSACVSWALYGQARSAAGGFEFSVCGDDTICLFRALQDMAYYIAGQ
jgi:hypothetical protein